MLGVAGHNPMGNVLHIITGPETDVFTDIHGAKIMDITDILSVMNPQDRVFLSLTRCKSEPDTEAALLATGTSYKNSFNNSDPKPAEELGEHAVLVELLRKMGSPFKEESKEQVDKLRAAINGYTDSKKVKKPKAKQPAVCSFCKRDTELLPIPGFKICKVCAQIEIGKNTKKDKND